jgi:putative ABC transport system permease protein
MRARVPLAWLQLTREKLRLLAALAGISFAVILMLMQLGFEDALFTSAAILHSHLQGDLVLISRQYEFLIHSKAFPEQRLYQALAVDGVAWVAPVYLGQAAFKNPDSRREHRIFLIAFEPAPGVLDLPGVDEKLADLRLPDVVLFDAKSRPEFGPVPAELGRQGRVFTEVGGRRVEIAGLFELGTNFGSDGNLITSDMNFRRLVPAQPPSLINLGLVKLKAGVDPEKIRAEVESRLPNDVQVLTHQGFIDLEKEYWGTETPIGFVFTLGVLMGLIVGCVIVYQILYTDVSDHLAEYATMKAMGYRDRFLFSVVLEESLILSVLGFFPGLAIAQGLYWITVRATLLPLHMTWKRVILVYLLTAVMCAASGGLAMRKLRSADPAEIF